MIQHETIMLVIISELKRTQETMLDPLLSEVVWF